RPLRQRFVTSGRAERAKLEPNLDWFVANYPNDGLAPLARVYLALIAVDRNDHAKAEALVGDVLRGPPGSAHDLAELVQAAIVAKAGNPSQAFERLLPLVGKLIDPYARALFDESIVEYAIGAQR